MVMVVLVVIGGDRSDGGSGDGGKCGNGDGGCGSDVSCGHGDVDGGASIRDDAGCGEDGGAGGNGDGIRVRALHVRASKYAPCAHVTRVPAH